MDQYFLVFMTIHSDPKGRELCKLTDIYNDSYKHLRGFKTKRMMKEFVEEYKTGIYWFQMLKPIT